jgi:hypothetical protein
MNFKSDVSIATLRLIKIGKFNTAVSYHMSQTMEGTIGIERSIRHQSSFLGYSDNEVFELFRHWVMSDDEPLIMFDSDQYWHVFRGRSNAFVCLAQVALKFITLGAAKLTWNTF